MFQFLKKTEAQEIFQDLPSWFTWVAGLGREGMHLGSEGILNKDLQFSFLQHEDWNIPKGIEMRIPLGDNQGEPGQAQYMCREWGFFILTLLSLGIFKNRVVGPVEARKKCWKCIWKSGSNPGVEGARIPQDYSLPHDRGGLWHSSGRYFYRIPYISGLKEQRIKSLSCLISSCILCMPKNVECAPSKHCFTSHFYSKWWDFCPILAGITLCPGRSHPSCPDLGGSIHKSLWLLLSSIYFSGFGIGVWLFHGESRQGWNLWKETSHAWLILGNSWWWWLCKAKTFKE